jgi:UDP-N-acetylbacillosamine N-acetyltransferase
VKSCVAGLVIYGYGGHARSVADVALTAGIRNFIFVDSNARDGETFLDFAVKRDFQEPLPAGWQCFAAAGDNRKRQLQVDFIVAHGWPLATIAAPTSTVGAGAVIAEGCFLAHHSHVGPLATIGRACILNTGCIVEHDCHVGDFAHVSVNSTVAGGCRIGNFVFLGAGSVVKDGCSVPDETICGAGTVVTRSLATSGTYVGAPARLVSDPARPTTA